MLVVCNHTSGNLELSIEDMDVTKRLKQAGDILSINVLDHLVFGEDGFFSMLERGMF
ncbi:MAG: hypothetical protein CVV52_00950 [Spirochaetae bacterium HGW-Spirochaetae-8]|nr:MAG: hypothetical protein CVV52_00950 [Spirochaetae bacterium HGW-Spirochaetae-8]